tara:strand:- start:33 stop:209 length:177 start_codon:yes stop_codon:yes gene_type:complete
VPRPVSSAVYADIVIQNEAGVKGFRREVVSDFGERGELLWPIAGKTIPGKQKPGVSAV